MGHNYFKKLFKINFVFLTRTWCPVVRARFRDNESQEVKYLFEAESL